MTDFQNTSSTLDSDPFTNSNLLNDSVLYNNSFTSTAADAVTNNNNIYNVDNIDSIHPSTMNQTLLESAIFDNENIHYGNNDTNYKTSDNKISTISPTTTMTDANIFPRSSVNYKLLPNNNDYDSNNSIGNVGTVRNHERINKPLKRSLSIANYNLMNPEYYEEEFSHVDLSLTLDDLLKNFPPIPEISKDLLDESAYSNISSMTPSNIFQKTSGTNKIENSQANTDSIGFSSIFKNSYLNNNDKSNNDNNDNIPLKETDFKLNMFTTPIDIPGNISDRSNINLMTEDNSTMLDSGFSRSPLSDGSSPTSSTFKFAKNTNRNNSTVSMDQLMSPVNNSNTTMSPTFSPTVSSQDSSSSLFDNSIINKYNNGIMNTSSRLPIKSRNNSITITPLSLSTRSSSISTMSGMTSTPATSTSTNNNTIFINGKRGTPEKSPQKPVVILNKIKGIPKTRGRKPSLIDDGSKQFGCEYCSRKFKRQEHLKRHVRSLHIGEKPFHCSICNKNFSRSDNLNQHIKTHKNNKSHSNTHS